MDEIIREIKNRSKRNKTIDFPIEQADDYLKKAVYVDKISEVLANSVVVGDAFAAVNKIADASIDLLVVDPPYNLEKDFHGNSFKKMSDEDYYTYTEHWINAVYPKLKRTASVYVCCDWKCSAAIYNALKARFNVRNRITWQREKGRGSKDNWKNSMEDVYYATVGEKFTFNLSAVKQRKKVIAPYRENGVPKDWKEKDGERFRLTCPSNFWDDISVPYWSMAENTAHPTQKPEKLIAKMILASSNEGDLVFDPFGGSGTTGVVAKKLGRRYVVSEQNPLYCAWAIKRLEDADADSSVQGYENGIFFERNYRHQK